MVQAVASALLLLTLVGGGRLGLSSASNALQARQDSLDADFVYTAQILWDEPITQNDLHIYQERMEEVREQIPREDKDQPPEWRTTEMLITIPEYSITSFRGDINLQMGEREKDGKRYSGYLADVDLTYLVRNNAEFDSKMQFSLEMSYPHSAYQDVKIWMDNRPVSPDPVLSNEWIIWTVQMKAGETSSFRVYYTAFGTDLFVYAIPNDHLINESLLTITVDRLPVTQVSSLVVDAAPTEIRPSDDGHGAALTWKLNRTAALTRMGLRCPKRSRAVRSCSVRCRLCPRRRACLPGCWL